MVALFWCGTAAAQFNVAHLTMDTLDSPGAEFDAYDLNEAGQVVGQGYPSVCGECLGGRAIGWHQGTATVIGIPDDIIFADSAAFAVNNLGQAGGFHAYVLEGPGGCYNAGCSFNPSANCRTLVCGSNGVTYDNACYASVDGAGVDFHGSCQAGPGCDTNEDCQFGPSTEDNFCFGNDFCVSPDAQDTCLAFDCRFGPDVTAYHSTVFFQGEREDWGSLADDVWDDPGDGAIIAINDTGQVAAVDYDLNDFSTRAYLAGLPDGGIPVGYGLGYDEPFDINSNGWIVGAGTNPLGDTTGWVEDFNGGAHDIGTLGGNFSEARGINDLGQVVGLAQTTSGETHAFVLEQGPGGVWFADDDNDGANDLMVDLGTLGGTFAEANAINNLGQVVGEAALADGNPAAFIWLPTDALGMTAGMHDLSAFVPDEYISRAVAINDGSMVLADHYLFTPNGYVPPDPPSYAPFITGTNHPWVPEFGEPVNLFTGELVERPAPDIDLGGPLPVTLQRFYASGLDDDVRRGSLGLDWRHNHEWTLTVEGDDATVVDSTGRRFAFVDDAGTWVPAGLSPAPFALVAEGNDHVFYHALTGLRYRFDDAFRLVEVADFLGHALTLTWENGALRFVSDGLGRTIELFTVGGVLLGASGTAVHADDPMPTSISATYTQFDDQLTSAGPGGAPMSYVYDPAERGQLSEIRDGGGALIVANVYDGSGRVIEQTDGDGNTVSYAYFTDRTEVTERADDTTVFEWADGALAATVDADGRRTDYGYDAQGRRVSITSPSGGVTTIGYDDETGQVSDMSWPDGTSASWTWTPRDVLGLVVPQLSSRTFPDGTTESYTYAPDGTLSTLTDQGGGTWTFTWDAGRPTGVQNPAGATWTTAWTDGRISGLTSPDGGNYVLAFGAGGQTTTVTAPDDSVITQFPGLHHGPGQVLAVDATGAADLVLTLRYDENNRLFEQELVGGGVRRFLYDAQGRPIGSDIDDEPEVRLVRDFMGLVTSMTSGPASTTFGYDARGLLVRQTDGTGATWTLTRDEDGAVTESSDPDGVSHTFARDERGRTVSITDGLSRTTSVARDDAGRITSLTRADGTEVQWTYDDTGLLTGVSLPGDIAISATRSSFGIETVTDGRGEIWTTTRDNQGRVVSASDPVGHTRTVTHNLRGLPDVETFADGSTRTFEYNAFGRSTSWTYSGGLTLSFDWLNGRLVAADGLTLGYETSGRVTSSNGIDATRDVSGRLRTLTHEAGRTVTYDYDAAGRVVSVTDWTGAETTFGYSPGGRLASIARPNGVTTTFAYDDAGALATIVEETTADLLASHALTRDALGRVSAATRVQPATATAPATSVLYAVDGAGQITGQTWDARGRWLSDGTRSFTWDEADRLTGYAAGGQPVTFTHDAMGLPTSRDDGQALTWVWSYAFPVPVLSVERDAGGAAVQHHVYTPSGRLLATIDDDGAHHWYHFDESGNVVMRTDDAGAVSDAYAYTPYGRRVVEQEAPGTVNRFTYAGQWGAVTEPGTSLVVMRRRVYDADTGRFLNREPDVRFVHPGAVSPYQYALADPRTFVDYTGEAPEGAADTNQDVNATEVALKAFDIGSKAEGVFGFIDGNVVPRIQAVTEAPVDNRFVVQGVTAAPPSTARQIYDELGDIKAFAFAGAANDIGSAWHDYRSIQRDLQTQLNAATAGGRQDAILAALRAGTIECSRAHFLFLVEQRVQAREIELAVAHAENRIHGIYTAAALSATIGLLPGGAFVSIPVTYYLLGGYQK